MRGGREVTSLAAGGLSSGSRGAGWICRQPLEQGERPCSFPLRKTDVLPPPARRTPLWITSSPAPPEGHLCWVLKPFHGWNSTNHPCCASAVGGTGYPPKQTHSRGPARLQQLWWERGMSNTASWVWLSTASSSLGLGWCSPGTAIVAQHVGNAFFAAVQNLLRTHSEFLYFPWMFHGKELQQEYLGGVFSSSHTFTSVYSVLVEISLLAHLWAVQLPRETSYFSSRGVLCGCAQYHWESGSSGWESCPCSVSR